MIGKNTKIYIAGSTGMVGSAVVRFLEKSGYTNLIGKTSKELNLINQAEVENSLRWKNPNCYSLSRKSRRHSRQRHFSGGIYL